jgi:hypothetical protein
VRMSVGSCGTGLLGVAVLAGAVPQAAGADEASMHITLEDQAKPAFAVLCGTIGVTVEQYPRSRRFRITRGEVSPVATLPAVSDAARGWETTYGARERFTSTGSAARRCWAPTW